MKIFFLELGPFVWVINICIFWPDSSFLKTQMQSSAPLVGSGSGSGSVVYSPPEPGGLGNSRSWFTYEELLEATNGFSTQNLLGEGGFGYVYKGLLPDGREVAVKQLKTGGEQGEREFKAEVEIISRIHHRYLVSLVGYCISDSRRLLVYDYVPNNNLYYHLHGKLLHDFGGLADDDGILTFFLLVLFRWRKTSPGMVNTC